MTILTLDVCVDEVSESAEVQNLKVSESARVHLFPGAKAEWMRETEREFDTSKRWLVLSVMAVQQNSSGKKSVDQVNRATNHTRRKLGKIGKWVGTIQASSLGGRCSFIEQSVHTISCTIKNFWLQLAENELVLRQRNTNHFSCLGDSIVRFNQKTRNTCYLFPRSP